MAQSHEENWPTATNPRYLLKLSRVRPSGRQYLLLACAVVRRLWSHEPLDIGTRVLDVLERFAFAQPRKGVQAHVWRDVLQREVPEVPYPIHGAFSAHWLFPFGRRFTVFSQARAADLSVLFDTVFSNVVAHARSAAVAEVSALCAQLSPPPRYESPGWLGRLLGAPVIPKPGVGLTVQQLRDEVLARVSPERRDAARDRWLGVADEGAARAAASLLVKERAEQQVTAAHVRACDLIREVFGNPFRPAAIRPEWLACNHGAARHIAEKIAATGDFTDLPILADALEDAGCCDQELLQHMRSGTAHVPGCWAHDAVLGK